MNLVKSSLFSSVATAVSFLSGFVMIKIVASQIGPAGIALVGQFQNTTALFALLGTLAINSGVVRAIAHHRNDGEEQIRKIFYNAIGLVVAVSLIASVLIFVFAHTLAVRTLHDSAYWTVFAFYAVFLTFLSINSVVTSFYNGFQEIKTLTAVNITSSLIGVAVTVIFAVKWGVTGVLIAGNFTTLSLFVINLFILKRYRLAVFTSRLSAYFDRNVLKGFLAFTLMNLASGVITPISQLMVRNKIMLYSPVQAGYWQGVTKISDYYLQFITTVLGIYYLPKLAGLQTDAELRTEIRKGYKIILPCVGVLALTIWLFREWIILILFSKTFLPMRPYFTFQLMGDFFKMASWLLTYLMVAKSMTRLFIAIELGFATLFVAFSYLFIHYYGTIGATYSFFSCYLCLFLFSIVYFRKYLF